MTVPTSCYPARLLPEPQGYRTLRLSSPEGDVTLRLRRRADRCWWDYCTLLLITEVNPVPNRAVRRACDGGHSDNFRVSPCEACQLSLALGVNADFKKNAATALRGALGCVLPPPLLSLSSRPAMTLPALRIMYSPHQVFLGFRLVIACSQRALFPRRYRQSAHQSPGVDL